MYLLFKPETKLIIWALDFALGRVVTLAFMNPWHAIVRQSTQTSSHLASLKRSAEPIYSVMQMAVKYHYTFQLASESAYNGIVAL